MLPFERRHDGCYRTVAAAATADSGDQVHCNFEAVTSHSLLLLLVLLLPLLVRQQRPELANKCHSGACRRVPDIHQNSVLIICATARTAASIRQRGKRGPGTLSLYPNILKLIRTGRGGHF